MKNPKCPHCKNEMIPCTCKLIKFKHYFCGKGKCPLSRKWELKYVPKEKRKW